MADWWEKLLFDRVIVDQKKRASNKIKILARAHMESVTELQPILVQRDNRTSLLYKKTTVLVLPLVACCVVIGTYFSSYNQLSTLKTTKWLFYYGTVIVVLAMIFVFVCIIALLNKNYMWLTVTYVKRPIKGYDIEDTTPFYLEDKGNQLLHLINNQYDTLTDLITSFSRKDKYDAKQRGYDDVPIKYDKDYGK